MPAGIGPPAPFVGPAPASPQPSAAAGGPPVHLSPRASPLSVRGGVLMSPGGLGLSGGSPGGVLPAGSCASVLWGVLALAGVSSPLRALLGLWGFSSRGGLSWGRAALTPDPRSASQTRLPSQLSFAVERHECQRPRLPVSLSLRGGPPPRRDRSHALREVLARRAHHVHPSLPGRCHAPIAGLRLHKLPAAGGW